MLVVYHPGSFPIACASRRNEDALHGYGVHPNPNLGIRHGIDGGGADGDDGAKVDQRLLAGTD